jgi:hypothetical protein
MKYEIYAYPSNKMEEKVGPHSINDIYSLLGYFESRKRQI